MNDDDDSGLNGASISFIPVVNGAGGAGRKKQRGPSRGGGAGEANDGNDAADYASGAAAAAAYYPPLPGFAVAPAPMMMMPPAATANSAMYQPPFFGPGQPSAAGLSPQPPHCGAYYHAPPSSYPMPLHQQHQQMHQQHQPAYPGMCVDGSPVVMGRPVMLGGGGGAAPAAYPMNAFHNNGQAAMVVLMQDTFRSDFQTGLFDGVTSCASCLNIFYLSYCLLARQSNMVRNIGPNFRPAGGAAGGSVMMMPMGGAGGAAGAGPTLVNVNMPAATVSLSDQQLAQSVAAAQPSWNGCCAAAVLLDLAHIAAAVFFPQITGVGVTGMCLQTMDTRAQIRRRLNIRSALCSDCLASCLCTCCAVAQQQRELERAGMDPRLVCCGPSAPTVRAMR